MKKILCDISCVHNSCRSQIAEALGKYLAADVFESYSAGTELKSEINQDAVRMGEGDILCFPGKSSFFFGFF